jgi:hypothetical protein
MKLSEHKLVDEFLASHQRDLRFTGVHFVMRTRRGWNAVDDARLIELYRQMKGPPLVSATAQTSRTTTTKTSEADRRKSESPKEGSRHGQ